MTNKENPLVSARQAIDEEWQRVFEEGGIHGRTWSKRGSEAERTGASLPGSQILLGLNGEIAIIYKGPDDKIRVAEFTLADEGSTALGRAVIEKLQVAGLLK